MSREDWGDGLGVPDVRSRPEPTTMPSDGDSRDTRNTRVELPEARLHGARASLRVSACIAVLAVACCIGFGRLLSRIDDAREAAAIAQSDAARAYAHTAVLEARLVQFTHRDVKPDNVIQRVDVCIARTDALRSAIRALVRLERVAMPGDPGMGFIQWPEVPR